MVITIFFLGIHLLYSPCNPRILKSYCLYFHFEEEFRKYNAKAATSSQDSLNRFIYLVKSLGGIAVKSA